MKRGINPFTHDHSPEKLKFVRAAYNELHHGQQDWLNRHNALDAITSEGLDLLAGAALDELYLLTDGKLELVTPELVKFAYAGIEPDPDLFHKPGRD